MRFIGPLRLALLPDVPDVSLAGFFAILDSRLLYTNTAPPKAAGNFGLIFPTAVMAVHR